MAFKTCAMCKKTKHIDEFQFESRKCIPCFKKYNNERQKKWYAKNKERDRKPYAWKPKKCIICDKEFQTTGPHQNYCSLQCRFVNYPIDKHSDSNGCWIWTGTINPKGYGSGAWNKRMRPAHQLSWECFYGPRPKGLCVCHSCHNPPCVNPAHLYLATPLKNSYDSKVLHVYAKKLTPEDVMVIKKLFDVNISRRKIARMFNVSHASIDCIYHGKTWIHI